MRRPIPDKPTVYTTKYDSFRGVDFSTDPALIHSSRSPLCQNLISDSGGYPEKRLGWKVLKTVDGQINGIFRLVDASGVEHILVHHGSKLSTLSGTTLFSAMNNHRATCFYYANRLYLLDGANYLVYDGSTVTHVRNNAYVPTTIIAASADGAGTEFEEVNMLTPKRKNSFKGDGSSKTFHLDAQGLDSAAVSAVVDNATIAEGSGLTVDRTNGTVTFTTAPSDQGGVDNVVVTFSKTVSGYADKIQKCTMAVWFGAGENTRVFVSGNPDEKNVDWHSGLYDPTYFPDRGYTRVGSDASAIMGYLRQYDNLLIIKEDNDQDATMFVRTAEITTIDTTSTEIDANMTARTVISFPVQQGVAGVGAISPYAFATLRDDPLFLSTQGVFTPTLSYGGAGMQRSMQNRSYYVDAKLTKETNLEEAVAAVWNGYYVLCVNGVCYVADSRQRTGKGANEAAGYEWYYWTNIPARVMCELNGHLYFGTADGKVCMFKDDAVGGTKYNDGPDEVPIDAVWATKQDDDGDFMMLKTMQRLGCGIMIKPYSRSSVEVAFRTDDMKSRQIKAKTMDVFDFDHIDFTRFSFSTNDAPQVMAFNAWERKYRTCQIIARNREKGEGFGIFGMIKRFRRIRYVK